MIRDAKDKLQGFHAEHSPKPADSPNGHGPHAQTTLEDEEIIRLCRKARNAPKFEGLFDRGDTSGYGGDDSAADQAQVNIFAFYTQDLEQLDRLFRRSALCRAKWTGRPDYRERTIRYALGHLTETYSPDGAKRMSKTGDTRGEPPEDGKGGEKQPPQSETLVRYASEAHVDLFHAPAGDAYGMVPVGDHHETHQIRSKGFRQFLRRRFREEQGKIPGSQAVQDALEQLEGEAQIAGEERPVHVRVAEHEGAIYLDLANARWEVAEVTASGWRVLSSEESPVRFRRPRGMLPLPTPAKSAGGTATGLAKLRRCINLKDEESWRLIAAWLVAALKPSGPYPILILQGEQGSAKSTVERLLKASMDPSVAPLRTAPRNEHDLYIGADSSHIVAFDNISNLPPWLSDASCRLSTGGGFSTRTLYENREQELFEGMRPQMMNGISDVATRPDLLDRAVIVTLPRILEEDRRPEAELWRDFEQARPAILGALLDAVSGALHAMPSLRLEGMKLPRMADFALWAVAAEKALRWEPGAFMQAYAGNRAEATQSALDADPVAEALREFMRGRTSGAWTGTMSELWEKLSEIAGDDIRRTRAWPGAPNALTGRLRRIAPALRDTGIEYAESADGKRTKSLKKIDAEDRQARKDRQSEEKDLQNSALPADDGADDDFVTGDKTVSADGPGTEDRQQETPANKRAADDTDGPDADLHPSSKRSAAATSEDVRKLFKSPPGWLKTQARICREKGAPKSLSEPLAAAVAAHLYESPEHKEGVLPAVEAVFHPLDCECEECL